MKRSAYEWQKLGKRCLHVQEAGVGISVLGILESLPNSINIFKNDK